MKTDTGTIKTYYASAPSLFGGQLEADGGTNVEDDQKAIEALQQNEIRLIKELGLNPMDLIAVRNNNATPINKDRQNNTKETWESFSSKYLKVLESNRKLVDATLISYKASYDLLPFILGENRSINSFTNEDMESLYSGIGLIPTSYKSNGAYKDLSFTHLKMLGLPKNKLPSIATRNNKFSQIKSVFEKALTQGLITRNTANAVEYIKDHTPNNQKRQPFNEDDLTNIFTHTHYTENGWKKVKRTETPNPYTFWLFPLALFTGARMNELLQLKTKNIGHIGDIWYIDFENEFHPETGKKIKSVKNINSIRRIPISDTLIELGFLKFVNASRDGFLFPEVYKRANPKAAAQKQLSKRLDQMGVRIPSIKTFHSLRHTFINHAINQGASTTYVGGVTGHLDKKDFEAVPEIAKTYFKGHPIDILKKEVIDRLNFDIDFSGIKWLF